MPIDYFPIFRNTVRWGDIGGSIAEQNDLQQALNSASSGHTCNLDISSLQEKVNPDLGDLLLLEDSTNYFQQNKVKLSSIFNPIIVSYNWNISGEIKVQNGLVDYINPAIVYVPLGFNLKLISAAFKLKSGSAEAKLLLNGDEINDLGNDLNPLGINSNLQTIEPTAIDLDNYSLLELVIISTTSTPQHLSFSIFIQYERKQSA